VLDVGATGYSAAVLSRVAKLFAREYDASEEMMWRRGLIDGAKSRS
jgi:hypothetical protein